MEKAPIRSDPRGYDRYLRGMDSSMRQKVALTAAHLLGHGRVADMGMGSGAGSHSLAALYPALQVVGVDLDPTMVALAARRFRLPNLAFVAADVAVAAFAPACLDGIFDSSVLHHVTTFGGYRRELAIAALESQVPQLRSGGVLIVRDFVDPGPGEALLDLPADDGDASDDPRRCSTAALFVRAAREFRSLSARPGFPFEDLGPVVGHPGWRRFGCSLTHAAEFLLRKDYREDWEAEIREEYTFLTREGFEAEFARLGLRLLASTPIRNPWIVRHRFEGRALLRSPAGEPLDFPPTNFVIAGERVAEGQGVRFRPGAAQARLGFLRLSHHRQRVSGEVFDLVQRPYRSLDVVPYFHHGEELFVVARTSYPRPILATAAAAAASLDGSRAPHYVAEPLLVLQTDQPLGLTVEECLRRDAGIAAASLFRFRTGATYYPSPGGILEETASVLVETEPFFVRQPLDPRPGFSASGRVRAIEARQLLRSAQVGGLPDARLELNVYELLRRLGESPGDWIGDAVTLAPAGARIAATPVEELRSHPRRRAFELVTAAPAGPFLDLACNVFEELDARGTVIHREALEYVVPSRLSACTLAVAPLADLGGRVGIALEDRDLPAAQGISGHSDLWAAPAWRLPRGIHGLGAARSWLRERLLAEHGLVCGDLRELGGRYHPSAGLTPEVVYPFAVDVIACEPASTSLRWVALDDLLRAPDLLRDGHLRILAWRAAHALGMLNGGQPAS